MTYQRELREPVEARWVALVASLAVAGVISLSVHVVMLQVLDVPFPEADAPIWASFLNLAGTTTALIAFQVIARDNLGRWWRTVALSGLMLFMLKEGLRGAVMNGVVTTAWVFALAGVLVPLALSVSIAIFCAFSARRIRSVTGLVIAGLLTGGLALALQVIVSAAVSPLMAWLSPWAHPELYQLPYPTKVLIPAYLTFAEPVIGCCLTAALIWDRLRGSLTTRLTVFTLLVVFLKGVVIRTFVYPGYMPLPFVQGVISQSQFLLEFATLGVLTAAIWHRFGRKVHRRTPSEWLLRRRHDNGNS